MRLVVAVLVGVLAAGCSGLLPRPTEGAGEDAGISISNGTELDVTLVVNSIVVRAVPRGSQIQVPPSELPPMPWSVEARSPSGRQLVSMMVRAGDVGREGDGLRGTGARADLSCGRLDIWSGPPTSGPMPGPGAPGDCEP